MPELCGCGLHVIEVAGMKLDAEPHPLGIWHPDGTKLSSLDIVDGHHGHRRHFATRACSTTGQAPLFTVDA